jgi:hypothetical protein
MIGAGGALSSVRTEWLPELFRRFGKKAIGEMLNPIER